jgi:hypothetical protein
MAFQPTTAIMTWASEVVLGRARDASFSVEGKEKELQQHHVKALNDVHESLSDHGLSLSERRFGALIKALSTVECDLSDKAVFQHRRDDPWSLSLPRSTFYCYFINVL